MPIITINLYLPCAFEEKRRMARSASACLAEAFGHPEKNITVRLKEYAEEDFYFAVPRELPSVQVEVICFPGRSRGQKQAFHDGMLAACTEALGRPVRLLTIFSEPPRENWISTAATS